MIQKKTESYEKIQNDIKKATIKRTESGVPVSRKKQVLWLVSLLLCLLLFEICLLVSVAPLQRLANAPLMAHVPTSGFLQRWGVWLPADLHILLNATASRMSTNTLEFVACMVGAFFVYGLAALLLRYQPAGIKSGVGFCFIWIGAIVAGLIFVCTPAMLSHDLFIYADYGRMLVVYGANPYFVIPASVSHDAITHLDDWRYVTAAYGPVWLYICSFCAWLLGASPLRYIFAFRLLALASHLCNTLLVIAILRTTGRSARTQVLGAWLYACNPLALFESCLGAHNDTVMMSFVLLGLWLSLWAERRDFTRVSSVVPALAFTLSALIKFTTAPLIVFFLVLLARKTFSVTRIGMLVRVCVTGAICGLTALILYAPFWLGHSFASIKDTFTSTPSAKAAQNSILRAVEEWVKLHGLPAHGSLASILLSLFNQHDVWSNINMAVLAIMLLAGTLCLWYRPGTQTLALVALATLGALLIVTPWFYPWYVLWLLGLAVVSLSSGGKRVGQALVAFTLTFSVTALGVYVYRGEVPLGDWAVLQCLRIMGVPLLVFLLVLLVRWPLLPRRSTGFVKE